MRYIDSATLKTVTAREFNARAPFPWWNPTGFLTQEGFEELTASMPDVAQFRGFFGKQRKHGQRSHDRYVLDYEEGMTLAVPWQRFIDELMSDTYRKFVADLLGCHTVRFRFHWHYTPTACEVSPHCDSAAKLGNHIFYMNTDADWDSSWGGATVLLEDTRDLPAKSNPDFGQFANETTTQIMGNRSLLMALRDNSWHGVHRLTSPEETFRKVFIVVFYGADPFKTIWKRLRRAATGRPLVSEKERHIY